MNIKFLSIAIFSLYALFSCTPNEKKSTESTHHLPNIIIIYADDLGYGDVGAYGAEAFKTPNFDSLAQGGLMFSRGYATSATCTPSRYALLTGSYPWRNENARILPGDAPLIIGTDQLTLPKMLKEQGYITGVVGKWHLGLGLGKINWNEKIAPGPNDVGFDYSYIMAATQDRVPTVLIENGLVVGLDPNDPIEVDYKKNFEGEPTALTNPEMLKLKWHHGHNNSIVNGIPRIGFMKGGKASRWIDENMSDTFLVHAKNFIVQHKDQPFFLYYGLQQPHVPRTPHPRFVGTSGLGARGDVIVEADWNVGELMKTLREEGLLENTLIIFSSDNGPVINDGYYDEAVEKLGDHEPWGPFRGGKNSLFEAGTRVPFITYWKGKIKPGKSEAMVCHLDFLNSLAKLSGSEKSSSDGENMLAELLGKSEKGRENLIIEAQSKTAFRKDNWIMIPPYRGDSIAVTVNIELGNSKHYQLYDLSTDIGQQKNLAWEKPEKLKEMIDEFRTIRGDEYHNLENLKLK